MPFFSIFKSIDGMVRHALPVRLEQNYCVTETLGECGGNQSPLKPNEPHLELKGEQPAQGQTYYVEGSKGEVGGSFLKFKCANGSDQLVLKAVKQQGKGDQGQNWHDKVVQLFIHRIKPHDLASEADQEDAKDEKNREACFRSQ